MKDLSKYYHSIIDYEGKKILVCKNHCCDKDGEVVNEKTSEADGQ